MTAFCDSPERGLCLCGILLHLHQMCMPSWTLTLYVKQNTNCGLSRSKWGMYKSWPCRAVAFKAALAWIQVAFNYNSQSWLSGPRLSDCCKNSSHNLLQENDSPAGEQLFWFRAINASNTLFVESAASLRQQSLSWDWNQIHKAVRDVILRINVLHLHEVTTLQVLKDFCTVCIHCKL